MSNVTLETYVRSGRDRVSGWLSRVDAEIFRLLLRAQTRHGLGGAGAEIGVHHGKAFLAICLGLAPGERAYCIDIFERQELNLDRSGRGDREQLEANLAAHGIAPERVVIRACSSAEVISDEILAAVGPVRFFSVDGGHWREIVENDLAVAAGALAPWGVIALDDFHRAEWPEVSDGYFGWRAAATRPFVPFAIGFNKLFICAPEYAALYRGELASDGFLGGLVVKEVAFQGVKVPLFNRAIQPEFSTLKHLTSHLRIVHPEWFAVARRTKARFSIGHGARGREPPQDAPAEHGGAGAS